MADQRSIASENSEYDPLLGHAHPSDVDQRKGLARQSSTNLMVRLRRFMPDDQRYYRGSPFTGILERLCTTVVIIGILIAISIKLQFADTPDEYDNGKVTFNFRTDLAAIPDLEIWDTGFSLNDSYKVETHSHTTKSDGNMTPKQLIQWADAYGFNAVFLSDHNNLDGIEDAKIEAAKRDILVIPTMEYTCCRIHMNLVNVTNATSLQPLTWPSDKELQRVINETHSQGGYVVVNHLPWSQQIQYGFQVPVLPQHPSIDNLFAWGVDAIESAHDNVIDLRMARLSERENKTIIASNDIHYSSQPAYVWTILKRSSLPDNVTADAILEAIFIQKQSTFIYSATGAAGRAYPVLRRGFFQYAWFAPWTTIQFGWLFTENRGMYSFTGEFCQPKQFELHVSRIIWFLIWIILAYITYELLRAAIVMILCRLKITRKENYRMK